MEGLEHFLHKAYLGQKRFSIEGLDAMVPMLDLVLELAAEGRTKRAVIGMAHRGRLNVLTHIVGLPVKSVLAEFEAGKAPRTDRGAGDRRREVPPRGVRQHETRQGTVAVTLMPNPSHLEAVNPVVEGRARAEQADHRGPLVKLDIKRTVPILIHGDAAFAAQGVVAETFNLSRLEGYANGGTVHLIANNQIGFTTLGARARSTTWASDLAKGFDVPIIHVNADDPEACLDAVRLAMAYRASSTETSSSTWSATGATATTRPMSPRTASPGCMTASLASPRPGPSTPSDWRGRGRVREAGRRDGGRGPPRADGRPGRGPQGACRAAARPWRRGPPSESPDEPPTGVGMDVLLALNEQVHAVPSGSRSIPSSCARSAGAGRRWVG